MIKKIILIFFTSLLFCSNTMAEDAVTKDTVSTQPDNSESTIRASAAEDSKTAEDELSKLEQVVGESAVAEPAVVESTENNTSDKAVTNSDEQTSKPWLPAAKEYDWVQLTSGEWLKGHIKAMYNDSLEFDSDKLDMLDIDWQDVKYLKSYRPGEVNVEGYEPVTGSLQISGDTVTVTQGDTIQEFDRVSLISLTPSAEREADLWEVKFNFSLNVKQGNTEQLDYTAKFNTKRRTAKSRFLLDYIGNISKNQSGNGALTETINNHRINASYNIYATRYFFYQPVFAEWYRDPFQNIDARSTVGVGIGYTIFDKNRFEWSVSGGPAYSSVRYIKVEPNQDDAVSTLALVFNTDVDLEITSYLDFTFKYKIQASNKESGGYTHHMIAAFESEITGSLDFETSLIWDRISQPRKDELGIAPEPDDFRLLVGITYTY